MTSTHSTDELLREIEDLKARLKEEQIENAMLRRLLFSQYARQPRLMKPLDLPISDRAIILFEVLPEKFDLEEVLSTAEHFGMSESEAAQHVRTYLQEGMVNEDERTHLFFKTGFRPYFQQAS